MQCRGQDWCAFPSAAGLAWCLAVTSLLVLPTCQFSLVVDRQHRERDDATSAEGKLVRADTLTTNPRHPGLTTGAPLTPDPGGQRAPRLQAAPGVKGQSFKETLATSRPGLTARATARPPRRKRADKPAVPAAESGNQRTGAAARWKLFSTPPKTLPRGRPTNYDPDTFPAASDFAEDLVFPKAAELDLSDGIAGAAKAVRFEALLQQEEVQQQQKQRGSGGGGDSGAEPHASRMVLTAVSTIAAVVGVCVMAAIFQCCCRKKRHGGGAAENRGGQAAETEKDQQAGDSKRSRSKSPSPPKTPTKNEDAEVKGLSEQDKLLEDDEDLGDFSMVQRETEILRSYRKPPPPKNRARASRVPRALKSVEPNVSPDVFQELVEREDQEAEEAAEQAMQHAPKPLSKKTDTYDGAPNGGHSSMLAEIDSTIAAIHRDEEKATGSRASPAKDEKEPKEAFLEKAPIPVAQTDGSPQVPRPKPRTKEGLGRTQSQEEMARSLAQELSKAISKENLSRHHSSKSPSPRPRSKDTSPKPRSPGSSPKLSSQGSSASDSRSIRSAEGEEASPKEVTSSNGFPLAGNHSEEKKETESPGGAENVFALVDPTASKDAVGGKSKIPVRAGETAQGSAVADVQPSAPLRHNIGKDLKRFPVPSVHGEKMDQLMISLKTRLKEDSSSGKHVLSQISSEGETTDDLDPQSRERAYSDPTKQNADKASCRNEQTHL